MFIFPKYAHSLDVEDKPLDNFLAGVTLVPLPGLSNQVFGQTGWECRTQRHFVIEGGKTERERETARGRGMWWEGRRTGGVKHQVTVYIPPRHHVAQTEEDQPPSLAKFTRQGQVYYTVVLMHCLIMLHSINIYFLYSSILKWLLFSFSYRMFFFLVAQQSFHLGPFSFSLFLFFC